VESALQIDILDQLYDICHTAAYCFLRICVMSVESSFAISLQTKYALLKKSPNVLLKTLTLTVPYRKDDKFHMTGLVLHGNKASELLFFVCCVVDIKCKKQTFKTTLLALMEQSQQLHADKICFSIHYYSPTCFAGFCAYQQGVIQEYQQHTKIGQST
jgi:hypothetical protein